MRGICVVIGLTDNDLLYINITSLPFDLVLLERYSVTPLNLPLRKCFFEIGPLIKAEPILSFIILIPILKHSSIYFEDLYEIFSKGFLQLNLTSIKLIFLLLILVCFKLFFFINCILNEKFNFFICISTNFFDPTNITGFFKLLYNFVL